MRSSIPLTRRLVALLLSWVLPASSVWASDSPASRATSVRTTSSVSRSTSPTAPAPLRAAAQASAAASALRAFLRHPRRYVRTTGPKNVYTTTVTVPATVTSPFTLRVQNGEADGSHRVSSAWIEVGGALVASPSDFNPNVAGFDRPVTLTSQSDSQGHAGQPALLLPLSGTPRHIRRPHGARGGLGRARERLGQREPDAALCASPTADPAGTGGAAASGVDTATLVVRGSTGSTARRSSRRAPPRPPPSSVRARPCPTARTPSRRRSRTRPGTRPPRTPRSPST